MKKAKTDGSVDPNNMPARKSHLRHENGKSASVKPKPKKRGEKEIFD